MNMKKHPFAKGINIRVTEPMYENLLQLADERNQHLAEYVRGILEQFLKNKTETK